MMGSGTKRANTLQSLLRLAWKGCAISKRALGLASHAHDMTFLNISYDRLLIRGIVIVAYLGWAAYASISLLPPAAPLSATVKRGIDITEIVTLLTFWMVFWTHKSPWTFYVYVAFPCYFWREFCLRGMHAFRQSVRQSSLTYSKVCRQGILVVLALQSMVVCYIFTLVLPCSQTHARRQPTHIDRYGALVSLSSVSCGLCARGQQLYSLKTGSLSYVGV